MIQDPDTLTLDFHPLKTPACKPLGAGDRELSLPVLLSSCLSLPPKLCQLLWPWFNYKNTVVKALALKPDGQGQVTAL